MIVNAGYRGKVGGAAPKFTYTGTYNIRKDGVVELLTNGTIVFLEPKVIDVFMVGGGGGGGTHGVGSYPRGYGGGGGGYTRTVKNLTVNANTSLQVNIGTGGTYKKDGGASAFGTLTVNGGLGAVSSASTGANGAAGGSGGGGGVTSNSDYGSGGYDGNSGEAGFPASVAAGAGQGFTTREFGENTGKIYAGGGGGGRYMQSATPIVSVGGTGGGGTGGWCGYSNTDKQAPAAGVANTGGGGGGGAAYSSSYYVRGASGGSGIVCFREAQELPELAGTWVLNERLYAPESTINLSTTFEGETTTGTKKTFVSGVIGTVGISLTDSTAFPMNIYNFSTNTWTNHYSKWTFPSGATVSDEFRAWLASNASKQ